jgi:hypothetical protein
MRTKCKSNVLEPSQDAVRMLTIPKKTNSDHQIQQSHWSPKKRTSHLGTTLLRRTLRIVVPLKGGPPIENSGPIKPETYPKIHNLNLTMSIDQTKTYDMSKNPNSFYHPSLTDQHLPIT